MSAPRILAPARAARAARAARDLAGKLWALPNTLLGLGVGAAGLVLGARPVVGRNAIEFHGHPLVRAVGAAAVTLGNTIHYAPGCRPEQAVARYDGARRVSLGAHERAHTRQYERLGPLFLVVYGAAWIGGLSGLGGRGNALEHAADDAAEREAAPRG